MSTTATLDIRSPFTGEVVGEVTLAGPDAIRAALDRGAAWGRAGSCGAGPSRYQRSEMLFGTAQRVAERREELAALITAESGLSLKDTRHELGRAVDVFRFAAIEALRDEGESFSGDVSAHGRDRRAHTLRVPVALVAAITPFNHPVNQVAHKLAPAIAAGAPVVLKPSEKAPLSALALLDILRDAGVPSGAAEVVCADPVTFLDTVLEHPAVELVSFTGGVAVGKEIARRLGYRRAVLELGGNDPLLVLGDADLEEATRLVVAGAFANSGQRCTAIKRVIAERTIADELAERVAAAAAELRVGDPADPETDLGTVIDEASAMTIERRIRDAVTSGARVLHGGERDGALLTPAVLDDVRPDMELVARETFGPVAPILRVDGLDEAIATANGTPYALSSGVCTFDWRAITRCVRELRAGTVNVREVPGWRTELTPFGGVGDSGLGVKEGVREAMKAMTYTKLYTLPWGRGDDIGDRRA